MEWNEQIRKMSKEHEVRTSSGFDYAMELRMERLEWNSGRLTPLFTPLRGDEILNLKERFSLPYAREYMIIIED